MGINTIRATMMAIKEDTRSKPIKTLEIIKAATPMATVKA
jgi:hypothetical protein